MPLSETEMEELVQSAEMFRDPAVEIANGMTFPELVDFLREEDVRTKTKELLQKMLKADEVDPDGERKTVNILAFLAAYMIRNFSVETMHDATEDLAVKVFHAAGAMLAEFEASLAAIKRRDPVPDNTRLRTLLNEFLVAFWNWKGPDQARLVSRIKHALMALFTALDVLAVENPAPPAHVATAAELNFQVNRLREKLDVLAGNGIAEAKSVIEDIDAWRRVNTGLPMPRPA